jgi:formylglycine-generating enzyme required for sulfatase activity
MVTKGSGRSTVRIVKPFAMGQYEITFEEYDKFAEATGRELPGDRGWGRGQLPVINVSWNDAMDYSEWLSQQTAKRYRLPTEAEWEYATRSGNETTYWWGNEMKSGMANCQDGGTQWSGKQTAPVGSLKPNRFKLYDTAGNVWEWVQDCWHENYSGAPGEGRVWKAEGGGKCDQRVIRGGSWGDRPNFLRSSNRYRANADDRDNNLGFRLAQDVD